MKQRFSSLDVKVIAHELSSALTSLRIANIYDLSSRIFLFKLAKPGHRQQLLVDSGFRCHLTSFNRTTAAAPSVFVSRLRKYLKSRRLTAVSQVGTDRIIDFQFSDGQYHMFLEFFAGGNIILTDNELNILALLRVVPAEGEQEEIRVGLKYTVSNKQNYAGIPPLTPGRINNALQRAADKDAAGAGAGAKKSKKKSAEALRKGLVMEFPEYPAVVLEHAFKTVGFDSTLRPEQVLQDPTLVEQVMEVFKVSQKVNETLLASEIAKGYIIATKIAGKAGAEETKDPPSEKPRLLYEDFHPFRPKQFEDREGTTILEFDGFNKTVDEFYSSIESQKLESKLTEREEHAKRKLENARNEHEKRVGALQHVQELHIRKAQAIEANLHRVEEAVNAVNGLIAQGMDWVEIGRLIEMEQSRQNAVAQIIKLPLKLYENTVTLLLGEPSAEEEAEDEGYETEDDVDESESEDEDASESTAKPKVEERLSVDIDLALSPWANARQYYDQKKSAAVKEQKTIESSEKALKNTEKKITADLQKGLKQEKPILRASRKQFWFEKFVFFISSDGYLVLGGKDAQQNELLYRRYLQKGDVYVHADLQGAASVIVKNRESTPDSPIPPSTLSQAGQLSVSTSTAWDSKAVMSAWWVNADQVSKTAPTGEYLTTGGFIIRGKKNFLPPAQLLLGFAVMFQISDESKVKHLKHRLQDAPGSVAPSTSLQKQDIHADIEPLQEEENSPDGDKADEEDEDFSGSDSESDAEPANDAPSNPLQLNSSNTTSESASGDSDGDEGPDDAEEALATREIDQENTEEPEIADNENQDAEEEQEDADGDNPENTPQTELVDGTNSKAQGTRHLSARERRLLKKGKPLDLARDTSTATSDAERGPVTPKAPSQDTPTKPNLKAAQLPRGKRGKNKKLASKYQDQDEEDRELAMRLLGTSAAHQEKAAAAAAAKESREAQLAAQKQRRREQHEKAAKAERARQARLAQAHADGISAETVDAGVIGELTELEKSELSLLDAFIGQPLPGDELIAAIPICAPWSALSRYKYKAKLQPGSQKKGKAVKEIMAKWTVDTSDKRKVDEKAEDVERIWPREAELVKAWRVEEIMNVVPVGKVRVMMAGGAAGGGADAKGGKGGKGKSGGGRGGRGSKKGR